MSVRRIGDITLIQLSDVDSNIYLVGDALIDTGTGFNFTRLRTIFSALKKKFDDVKHVVNTHAHFDHVGGNGYFFNAKVSVHEQDAPILEKGDTERSAADFFGGNLKARSVENKFKEGDKIKLGKLELEVIHTPGHSPGSVCLYDRKGKLLFSGDTIFADGVGRSDFIDGDPEALRSSIEKLLKLDVKTMLPGHGEPVLKDAKKVMKEVFENSPISERV